MLLKPYVKFASSTELHGFGLVLKNNKFWSAVWLCLTLAACGMCMNDLVNLVISYMSEPTIINLDLVANWDLDPPNPTLCMEVNVDTPGVTMENNFLYSFHYKTSEIDSDLSAFLAATQNASNLNVSHFKQLQLSNNLEYFTYFMLSYIAEAELTYIGFNDSVLTSYVTDHSMASHNREFVNATIAYLYHAYLSKNVSFDNLKRLIGMSICQQRTDSLTKQNSTYSLSSTICKPHMITHLSFSIICSKLLENDTDRLASYEKFVLNGTKLSLTRGQNTDWPIPPLTFISPKVSFAWHLDFQGRPMLPIGSRNDLFSWNPFQARSFEVTLATEYRFHSTRYNPCQSTEWQIDCEFNKRLRLVETMCGCRLSSVLYGVHEYSLPSCSDNPLKPIWILDSGTSGNHSRINYTDFCGNNQLYTIATASCARDCQIFEYDIKRTEPSHRLLSGMTVQSAVPGVVEFSLNMGRSRQLVVESAAKSFNTFVCDFGGSIGAWLGASLLAFVHAAIHMFITCYDAGKSLVGRKKNQQSPAIEISRTTPTVSYN